MFHQLPPAQPVRSIEHPITFKKKEAKPSLKSINDDDDLESGHSLKSANYSEDNHFTRKQSPLPQLNRQRRKLLGRDDRGGYLQKQVRQHQNILLKQRNNLLSSQNMKLKTKIMTLEKETSRLQKLLDEEPVKNKQQPFIRLRGGDNSLRTAMKGIKKQVEDLRKQNANIKSSVKFTSIQEIECQRNELLSETVRLRALLEEEQERRLHLNRNYQGISSLETKLTDLKEKNAHLSKQNAEIAEKLKKMEDGNGKLGRLVENEKNLNKMLYNARRVIKEKQKQIEQLKTKAQTNPSINNGVSANSINNGVSAVSAVSANSISSSGNIVESSSTQKKSGGSLERGKPRSMQKYGNYVMNKCGNCAKKQKDLKERDEQIARLSQELKAVGEGKDKRNRVSGQVILPPSELELSELIRFLTLRFKAHRLSFQQSQKYLVNVEDMTQLEGKLSLRQLIQSLFVEPFSIVNNRYLQILLLELGYDGKQSVIDESRVIAKSQVLRVYQRILPRYQVLPQEKEEEMFIQVAQLITNYYQQILAALSSKKNGEGTISEAHFSSFFKEIELEQPYVDFIITQIILESLDLQHLNYYAMFEIFYMPNVGGNKNKFAVDNSRVVHEQDEEYEESKSHLGSRHRTLEKPVEEEDDSYEEVFEEQKMNNEENIGGKAKPVSYVIEDMQE